MFNAGSDLPFVGHKAQVVFGRKIIASETHFD